MIIVNERLKIQILIFMIVFLLSACSIDSSAENIKHPGVNEDTAYHDIYLSVNGDNKNNGTQSNPVQDIERALELIKQYKYLPSKSKNIVIRVIFHSGVYEIDKPIVLNKSNGGNKNTVIKFMTPPNSTVKLSGGKIINNFKAINNTLLSNTVNKNISNNIYVANLSNLGDQLFDENLGDYSEKNSQSRNDIYFDNIKLQRGRWPNSGFLTIDSVTGQTVINGHGKAASKEGSLISSALINTKLSQEKSLWANGYWFWDWYSSRQKIGSIDSKTGLVKLVSPNHYYGYREKQWFYIYNSLSHVDSPGEYYLDNEKRNLFLWPPGNIKDSEVVISLTKNIFKIHDATNITFENLIIENTTGTSLYIKDSKSIKLNNLIIRNSGGSALIIKNSDRTGIANSKIYNISNSAIEINGGDRKTLGSSDNYVINNEIHNYATWNRANNPGINLSGVGNKVANNEIYNAPHQAIKFSGNEHVIEYNYIHDVCTESHDAGAIYAGRDWTMRGTIIRYNYFSDITGIDNKGCSGVYLDDLFSGTLIHGNIFFRIKNALLIGGGRDNTITNNIFYESENALNIDGRGQPGNIDNLVKRLKNVPYKSPKWRDKYPRLSYILDDNPWEPKGNFIKNNIIIGDKWDARRDKGKELSVMINNSINASINFKSNPLPKIPEAKDFKISKDGLVILNGFKQIPLDKIGRQNQN